MAKNYFDEIENPSTAVGTQDLPSSKVNYFDTLSDVPEKQNRDWFDVTIGAAEHGAADTTSLLLKSVNKATMGGDQTSSLSDMSRSLEGFKKNHPAYSPVEVENALQLVSDPKAMSSRIFGSAAYTGMMMGSQSIPAAGWLLSGLTSYGIESQRAYESAQAFGATEQQAETAARHTGLANAVFQIASTSKMLSVMKGKEDTLARNVVSETNSLRRAMGPSFELSKDAGVMAGMNAMIGAIDDKIALDTYGKPMDKDFWDKRLQEGAIGAATALLIGAPRTTIRTIKRINSSDGTPLGDAEVNVYNRDTAYRYFQDKGVSSETAKSMASMADLFANEYSRDTGNPKEEFFPQAINDKNFELGSTGNAVNQKVKTVFDSFEKDPAVAIQSFLKASLSTFSGDRIANLKDSLDIKDTTPAHEADAKLDSAFIKYLWDGEAPSPESAAPMENMKELLTKAYKNSAAMKDIPIETKIILDSMLAPETAEITQLQRRTDAVKKQIERDFPEYSSLLTDKDIKDSLASIQEETIRHEFDDILNVTKEIKETVNRKPTREESRAKLDELVKSRQPQSHDGDLQPSEDASMIDGGLRSKSESLLLLEDLRADLDRLRQGRLIPSEMSGVERRSQNGSWLDDQLMRETPKDTGDRNRIMDNLDRARSLVVDIRDPLRRYESGQIALDAVDEMKTRASLLHAPHSRTAVERFNDLGWGERKWLQQVDKDGYTNLEKILDLTQEKETPIPQRYQSVRDFRDSYWQMNADYGRQAEAKGILMRFNDGKWSPYKQPNVQRMLRLSTPEFRDAMNNPYSGLRDSILEKAMSLDPELKKMGLDKAKKHLDNAFRDSEMRTNSALESARFFKKLPSNIEHNGKQVKIFETDPFKLFDGSSKIQSSRLASADVLGQSVLSDVLKAAISRIAEGLGVGPGNDVTTFVRRIRDQILKTPTDKLQEFYDKKNVLKDGEEGPVNSVQSMLARMELSLSRAESEQQATTVVDSLSDRKALADAIKVAKKLGISLKPSRQEYIDAVSQVTATNMTKKQKASLAGIAKSLDGIDARLPPAELLSEIKSRMSEDTFDNIDKLKQRIAAESGGQAVPYFERVMREAQGIPTGISKTAIPSVVRSMLSIASSNMTILRAALHVFQTPWQVAPDAGFGNYIKAVHSYFQDSFMNPNGGTRQGLKILGAIPETARNWGFEKILSTENLGKIISQPSKTLESVASNYRQAVHKLTLVDAVMDFVDVSAGESYRRMALDLKNRPIVEGKIKMSPGDTNTLKGLEISSDEIKQISSGQMSETTFAKIVQNGVERVGSNRPSFKKSQIENSPIGRMLFAFSGYAINNGRILQSLATKIIWPALKSDDPLQLSHARNAVVAFTASAIGAGYLTQMLYNIPRGYEMKDAIDHEDDTITHRALGSLLKVGFWGPAARYMESQEFSGPGGWAVGMMPHVGNIARLVSLLDSKFHESIFGQPPVSSRYARYGFGRNMIEYAKSLNPLVRSYGNTLDTIMYPEKVDYTEARQAAQKYKKDKAIVRSSGANDNALDPDKEEILFYVERGDITKAIHATQEYYKNYVDRMEKNPRQAVIDDMSPQKAVASLRQSLENRSPLDLTDNEKLDFLSKLPADRLSKYYKTDLKYRAIVDSIAPKQR